MTFKVKTKIKRDGKAKDFALSRHGNQPHGCLKIEEHLEDVAKHVLMHYNPLINHSSFIQVESAAWLHDIIEDTDTTIEEVEERFGDAVSQIVSLLTDKDGRNRMERHLHTYHMIRRDPDALLIKLCDRRHNQERSIRHGERYLIMYEREYNYFKFALWTPHKFVDLWAELDDQYEEMKRALSW